MARRITHRPLLTVNPRTWRVCWKCQEEKCTLYMKIDEFGAWSCSKSYSCLRVQRKKDREDPFYYLPTSYDTRPDLGRVGANVGVFPVEMVENVPVFRREMRKV